jgi:hypothetical protein
MCQGDPLFTGLEQKPTVSCHIWGHRITFADGHAATLTPTALGANITQNDATDSRADGRDADRHQRERRQGCGRGVEGVTVFIDNNFDGVANATDNNGVLDAGERSTVTGPNGTYTFYGVPLGTWHVDEVTPAGQTQTTGNFETVTISALGQTVTVSSV